MTIKQPFLDTLGELRVHLTLRLAQLVLVFSALGMYFALALDPFYPLLMCLFALLVGLAWIVQAKHTVYPILMKHILVWGLNVALVGAMLIMPNPWVPFYGVLLSLIGWMLVSYAGLLTSSSVFLAALWLNHTEVRLYPLPELAIFLMLGTVLAWRTVRILYMALLWYSSMQQQADRLLQESRDSRAELARALKSLEVAYTTQRQMQRELIRARKQADDARCLKERFAANISHELRTPLSLILGFSEVMYLSPEVYGDMHWSPTLRRDIYQIHRSSHHLLEMIDDILDLSHFELSGFTVNLEVTDLNMFLEETLEIVNDLFRGHRATLEVNIQPDLPHLEIDRTRIRQALLNLLNNSRRFTEGGLVRLEVRQVDKEVIFSVIDTGSGIPDDKLEHIFDEFYQVDYSLSRGHGGAGLGLAITKRFVEAHKGYIWVTSEQGVGSNFTFSLPVPGYFMTPTYAHGESAGTSILEQEKPAVLVVDPDPALSAMIARYLDDYQVRQVENGDDLPEAVAMYRPQAIIQNVLPHRRYEQPVLDTFGIPLIECALPSQVWMIDDLSVAGSIAKPITAPELIRAIVELDGIRQVLILDDDRGFVQLVERIIQTSGLKITTRRAYDGEEGLRVMRENPPDLLLLDLAMPDADGFQVLDKMHQDTALADVRVILLTATGYADDIAAARSTRLTIHRNDGFYPAEILRCLKATVNVLEPRYSNELAFQFDA